MYQKLSLSLCLALLLAACAQAASPAPTTPVTPEPRMLRVMTHDSFAVSEDVVAKFEAENNVDMQFLKSGDTGAALTQAILSRNNPLADVFYGVDNTFLSRALAEDIFDPYTSSLLQDIPAQYQLDPDHRALPVDFGDVCPNYDIEYFTTRDLPAPQSLDDLLKPEYKSLLVVENPATSSPGLAFLLASIGHYGTDGYLDYWQGLVDNDVLVVNDWETAYYTEFSHSGGTRPIVISYASSPPFEVLFAETPIDTPPTGVISADGACFRQVEFVGILKGTPNRDLAEKWVDFMLSPVFQEDMPMQMAVFPVNLNAHLDEAFLRFMVFPENPAVVSPQDIAANREAWINAWTETVLK